jgi:hypothetical protein
LPNGEDTVVTGNYCEGPKYDAGFFFEFGWRGGRVVGNKLSGQSRGWAGMFFANCNERSRHALVAENVIEGFKGPLQIGGCAVVAQKNTIDCDDSSSAAVEKGYFGIALNLGSNADVAVNEAKDNLIKNCQIGVAIGQGRLGGAGSPVQVENNQFMAVPVPITGYVFRFRTLREHTAHQPLIPGSHVIKDNRDALTKQIVDAQ